MNDIRSDIVAVIVTYNRRAILERCLEAILSQEVAPKAIIVVDNHSTDDTEAFMLECTSDNERILYYRLDVNGGGSLGFNEGIKFAQSVHPEWIWMMDDDTVPAPTALRILLSSPQIYDPCTGFVCSRVIDGDGAICDLNIAPLKWEWPFLYHPGSEIYLIENCSFVSVLVRNSAIKIVGLPIKEFFIWWDDVEYTLRLSTVYRGYLNFHSVVSHLVNDHSGGRYDYVDKVNLWKYCYGIRNRMSIISSGKGLAGILKGSWETLNTFVTLVRSRKSPRIIFRLMKNSIIGIFFFNHLKKIEYLESQK